jgi:putative membrane-bound dehydrogenase-like protein
MKFSTSWLPLTMQKSSRRMLFLAIFTLLASTHCLWAQKDPYAEFIAQTNPRTPEEERKGFHVPAGFEVQLVAAEPDVRKPININFDDRGRLWVTESVEYPFAAKDHPGRDIIGILEINSDDGRATKATPFTGGLNIPIGVLPLSDGAIAYSIPNIYRFYDPHHTDHAERREVLMGSIGYRDTHGMTGEFTWGFDGWVYACHGYSNTSELKAKDGSKAVMNSGNVYRFRPDGSHIDQITHGQVNPFGLSFDPLGNLFSCDCHTRPVMMLLRGAFYESFGKPHDGLGFAPEIMTHDHGSTAIAGITYYAADHFPPEYRDTVFVGNVVTNRINHDRLEWHGSSPKAVEQPDFLTSDDPWFRPVDIKLGPDGALYVADFYNRIIGHYEVPLTHPGRDRERGRIWRIVYRGPDGSSVRKNAGDKKATRILGNAATLPHMPRADWGKASIDELVQDLGHANLVVRTKATNQLVERGGEEAVAKTKKIQETSANPYQIVHSLWVLERLKSLDDHSLELAAKNSDRGVRAHVMHILAERHPLTEPLREIVLGGLLDSDAFVRRAAADALGTHPAWQNIEALLAARHAAPGSDPQLVYTIRLALRNQLVDASSWQHLPDSLSEQDARVLADVAPGVHSAQAAAFLLHHLQEHGESFENRIRYVHHVARFGEEALATKLLAATRKETDPVDQQLALFRSLQQGVQARGGQLNADARNWGEGLARRLMDAKDDGLAVQAIELCGSLKLVGMQVSLVSLAGDRRKSEARRSAALTVLPALDGKGHVDLLSAVLADASEPIGLREKAANVLGGLNQPAAQDELTKALVAAPQRLALVIAMELAGSKTGAEKLLEAVATGKASPRLLQERPVEFRLAGSKLPDWKARIAKLTQNLPPADQQVQDLLKTRHERFAQAKKDPALGAKVFEKNCAICHILANKGAKIGPQLDGIGNRGLDRLLEDIIDPNRNVDQAFRLTNLNLKDGRIASGLVLREEGEVLVLADSQGKEVRVDKKSIEERTISPLSPMPANLVEQIPEADFYNLLAFLLEQRPAQGKSGSTGR